MHVITRKRFQAFWETHPDAERPLKAWLAIVRLKHYSGPHGVRQDFASASFLGKWRTVFNIGGNRYRLEDEYAAAVAEIDRLLDTDPPPDSEEYERLEFLSVLVQAYEDTHDPLYELTTPQDVVT